MPLTGLARLERRALLAVVLALLSAERRPPARCRCVDNQLLMTRMPSTSVENSSMAQTSCACSWKPSQGHHDLHAIHSDGQVRSYRWSTYDAGPEPGRNVRPLCALAPLPLPLRSGARFRVSQGMNFGPPPCLCFVFARAACALTRARGDRVSLAEGLGV